MEDLRNGWQRYADWLDRKEEPEEDEEGEQREGGVWHVVNGKWVQISK